MGRVYRRNRTWYVDYAVDGRRMREAIGTSKKLAAAVLREREAEIIKGEYNLMIADDLHMDSLVEKFLDFTRLNRKPYTHKRYRAVMEHFAEFLGEHREIAKMTDVRRHHVETYKSWRMGQISRRGRPPGTMHRNSINLELDILRAMFNFAVKFHGLRSNPVVNIERFKVVKARPRVLSETEVDEILRNSRGMYRSLFLVALYTGMRKGELQNLTWENLDFVRRLINIRPVGSWIPKTWEVRDMPMHPLVYDTLKSLARRSDWVFTSKTGQQLSHPRGVFIRICKKVGIGGATFHTLRHTFASHLLTRKGVDIETVSKLLGHNSIETTMIYLHTNMEIMRSGVERLDFIAEKAVGTNLAQMKTPRRISQGVSTTRKKMAEKEGFEPSIGLYSL